MKSLRFYCLLVTSLFIFSKFSISQIPDFTNVPNLNNGDSVNITSLINNGIEIKRKRAICWFPKDSLSVERMNGIADTLDLGVAAAEKFINAPLSWQAHTAVIPYTFYFRTDTIISHASLAGFVSISFWRIKQGKAPWLHEVLHKMLFNNGGNWFQKNISEEYFDKNMPLWLSEGLPDYITMEVSRVNDLSWYDVFSGNINPNVDSLFISDMTSKNGQYIIDHIGAKGVIPELSSKDRQLYAPCFYHGSSSFVSFIAEHFGVELLLNAISSFQKEEETIGIKTRKSMTELKNDWLQQIGVVQKK